ncbi:MAG: hypothetical protein JSU61_07735 [Fidelibacterota bacterium]|nr:MAG: hypothetical protein JSU61_07735 [Candidatus Neomarinimicrobiota bacterium]
MTRYLLILLAVSAFNLQAQEIIDVGVRGISDPTRDGAQKDRQEAILDAQRQACERAGLKIESATTVENFQTVYDYVETQAESVLLPGFQIIDNGYGEDGTYSVVLLGKVQTTRDESGAETAIFNIIVWFSEDGGTLDESYQMLDRLYQWLEAARGELTLDGIPIESLEDHLEEVSKTDSLYGAQRYYAFKYRLPTGTAQYIQRTSDRPEGKTQKIRLRPNLEYLFEVAAWNAVYFRDPRVITAAVSNPRTYQRYPENFKTIYAKP